MITYNDYPLLRYCSYTHQEAPNELLFELPKESINRRLHDSKAFQTLFGIIPNFNTLQRNQLNFWLNDHEFLEVEHNNDFRLKHFRRFMTTQPEREQYGVISFRNGAQYVYLYLPETMAKLVDQNNAYLCAALFQNLTFLGFEDAIFERNGLSVLPDGIYTGGMDKGGYLSFASICLSYFSSTDLKKTPGNFNITAATIWQS